MRIAFVDFTPWDYTPLTPDVAPLGGTQSAVCYLTRQLAADGFKISLVNGASRPGRIAGVSVVPLATVEAERVLADCRVAILVSTAHAIRKLKALLAIAGKVRQGGKNVTSADAEHARAHGATDLEIHDTVLIAAAFCMYNRYVDGLATWTPREPEVYRRIGSMLAAKGYLNSAR